MTTFEIRVAAHEDDDEGRVFVEGATGPFDALAKVGDLPKGHFGAWMVRIDAGRTTTIATLLQDGTWDLDLEEATRR